MATLVEERVELRDLAGTVRAKRRGGGVIGPTRRRRKRTSDDDDDDDYDAVSKNRVERARVGWYLALDG
eukprot:2898301-Prymnesium_polylepis.1